MIRKKILLLGIFIFFLNSCGELDYENVEFYKQEVYIISSESTSATEREIIAVEAFVFTDTLKIINEDYDTELIQDYKPGLAQIKFKIGIGGSLAAKEDVIVKVGFDKEALADYNLEKNTEYFIPDRSLYEVNVPFDEESETFTVVVKKGTSSSSLIFDIPVERDNMDLYGDFAFPLLVQETKDAILSRLYTRFMVANLVVSTEQLVNWSGFPIPKLPEGRYHSARLQGNGAENTLGDGVHRTTKFITRLGDTPELADKYTIWGTGVWSFEVFSFHSAGWMYNKLYLNDEVFGTYTMEPVLNGDPNYPFMTFSYSTVQGVSENNKYDPKTKTLTLYYRNVIGEDYVDILTYIGEDFTLNHHSGTALSPRNWQQVRSSGYNYWLPIE